jgi:MarR family transcriptional regulator, organic hydroperoxide resistance regulator
MREPETLLVIDQPVPLLKRTEAVGHLTRQRDPQDERQVRVRLTPQGRSVREKRSSLLNSTNFGPTEYEKLREQMVKLRPTCRTR